MGVGDDEAGVRRGGGGRGDRGSLVVVCCCCGWRERERVFRNAWMDGCMLSEYSFACCF